MRRRALRRTSGLVAVWLGVSAGGCKSVAIVNPCEAEWNEPAMERFDALATEAEGGAGDGSAELVDLVDELWAECCASKGDPDSSELCAD